jgi:putative phosphonate metabolism protein
MTGYTRLAIYYAPRRGAFAARAADWLGWDPETGAERVAPPQAGLPDPGPLTREARRYGFHGTLRAPFRLAAGLGPGAAGETVAALAARLSPVRCEGLELADLEGFLALVPRGDDGPLKALAAEVVEATDALRAPLSETEIARRRPDRLTPHQRMLLDRWGYPFVMDEFRFHLTLTDRLAEPGPVQAALARHFAPVLPEPFAVEDLCLFGEDASGRFHLVHRYALTG